MQIDDVKGEELRELIEEVHRGSMTIESDFQDAIRISNTEDELINIWQSALEGLKNEVEGYWSRLEGLKGGKQCSK